jgi:hypothetical protein
MYMLYTLFEICIITERRRIALERENWNIEYTWVKAHTGHYGNELADKLATEATRNNDVCYNKIPKGEIEHHERKKSIENWQQQWNNSTKGLVTNEFFPNIKDRLKMKMHVTPSFTAMVTAHGKTRSYLYCFELTVSSECPCSNSNQTVEHLIYACRKLNNAGQKLIAHISKKDNWPIGKSELVNRYLTWVIQFTNSIDNEKL